MRAKTVNEAQDFERDPDPKKSLKIGRDQIFLKDVKEELEELIDEMGQEIVDDLPDETILELRDEGYAAWQIALVITGESESDMFEAQNFERGKDPKRSMGIGGIDLFDQHEERMNDLKKYISMQKLTADEEWQEYLEKTLIGKTIIAEMHPLPAINPDGKTTSPKRPKGEWTIKVQDVKAGENFSDSLDRNFQVNTQIILADTENNMYSMTLREGDKIHFENES